MRLRVPGRPAQVRRRLRDLRRRPPTRARPACRTPAASAATRRPASARPDPAGAASCQVENDLSCGTDCAPCAGPATGPGRGICQPGPAVGAGTCAIACDAGNHACGGSCFADDDAAHCGPGCLACTAPPNASPLCEGGGCAFTCNPGWMRCGDGCCRASAVAAGGEFGCALVDDGRVRCWGANDRGQLGDGSTIFRPVPGDVVGLPSAPARAVALATGWAHACAVVAPGGQVWCWGDNTTGELGPGATGPFSSRPVLVTGRLGGRQPALALGAPAHRRRRRHGRIAPRALRPHLRDRCGRARLLGRERLRSARRRDHRRRAAPPAR